MNDKHIWVGYLSLANKKTLVASDDRVDTGNRKTLFLYNQERNDIVEYSREIIEAKLKAAPAADYNVDEIAAVYQKALRKTKPNVYRAVFTPNSGGSSGPKEKKARSVASDDNDSGDEIEMEDSFDMDDDSPADDSEGR